MNILYSSLKDMTDVSIQSAEITICISLPDKKKQFSSLYSVRATTDRKKKRKRKKRRSLHLQAESQVYPSFYRALSMQRRRDRKQERGEEEEKIGLSGLLDRQR